MGARTTLLTCCTFVLLLISGCSPERRAATTISDWSAAEQSQEQLHAELEIWSWNIAAEALTHLIPEFERRHPGIHVRVNMNGARMQSRLLLALSAGVGAPDISQLQLVDAPRYTYTGALTDLTPIAAQYKERFPSPQWNNCIYNGKIYAIPWDIGPCAVFYKRDIFRKYGVDAGKIETWDDFIAAGKQILERSHGQTKMMPMGQNLLSTVFELLIQQNGGQIFDSEGRVAINSPKCAQALEVMHGIVQAGIHSNIPAWGHEYLASINSDSIATFPSAVWFAGTIKNTAKDYVGNKEWGVFRLPALERGGNRVSNLGGSVLVIPAQCRNKAAAWEFIRTALCTVEGQVDQYRYRSLFPAYIPALSSPVFDEPDPFFGGQRASRLFATDIDKIYTLNRTRNWQEAMRYLDQAFSTAAANNFPTAGLLAGLEQKLHNRLGVDISPAAPARVGMN
jgi:lactose/L-arabinose transport system substrate-binding protein